MSQRLAIMIMFLLMSSPSYAFITFNIEQDLSMGAGYNDYRGGDYYLMLSGTVMTTDRGKTTESSILNINTKYYVKNRRFSAYDMVLVKAIDSINLDFGTFIMGTTIGLRDDSPRPDRTANSSYISTFSGIRLDNTPLAVQLTGVVEPQYSHLYDHATLGYGVEGGLSVPMPQSGILTVSATQLWYTDSGNRHKKSVSAIYDIMGSKDDIQVTTSWLWRKVDSHESNEYSLSFKMYFQ